jgi:hypothetical protein
MTDILVDPVVLERAKLVEEMFWDLIDDMPVGLEDLFEDHRCDMLMELTTLEKERYGDDGFRF